MIARNRTRSLAAAFAALLGCLPFAAPSAAQTQVKSGFNLFTPEQDVEIGRQSAAEVERQLPMLDDRALDGYLESLLAGLAAAAPGPEFRYQVRATDSSQINAFALPGGLLYVNRGLVEAARNEAELAGVIAHEVAHIALRHGTANASKAYLTQAGLCVLGGLLGKDQSRSTQDIINMVGGLGLNAVFLKYSRDAETQADIVGTQILARAGYDPNGMATFFDVLQEQLKRDPSRLEQFFSSHPPPANRAARIRQEAALLGASGATRSSSGEFARAQAGLRNLPPPRSGDQTAARPAPPPSSTGSRAPSAGARRVRVAAPSKRFATFRQRNGFFSLDVPDNWRAYEAANGFGVTIVPDGGVVDTGNGQQAIVYGVILNHYDPFDGRVGSREPTLAEATNDLLAQVQRSNPYLRPRSRSMRDEVVAGAAAKSAVLAGRSPVTREEERVTVFTRALGDGHVVYSLFIAPGRDYKALSSTFTRMMQSLRVEDRARHGAH